VPRANQGAFGGERVAELPHDASRAARQPVGPPQRALQEKLSVDDVRGQLGDAALNRLVQQAQQKADADDGNARVNPDIRADVALYDDGVGGQFERSVFIDPSRSARGAAAGRADVPLADQIEVKPPPRDAAGTSTLPVAYEVAAVGARLANMARVGGQRVQEMDHFVESTATPIVRLVLPGAAEPTGGRDATLKARKVLERKLLVSSAANCATVPLPRFPHAPAVRVLSALGDDEAMSTPPACVRAYGELLWEVLLEVVETIMGRTISDVVAGLYYMPTIRADVFVCSVASDEATGAAAGAANARGTLHINALVFQQSMSCDLDADDPTRPLRVSTSKWAVLLPYWLCRVTAALNETQPGSAHGIYDAGVRSRLRQRIAARAGSQYAGGHEKRDTSWRPPPLPTALLTR